MKVIREEMKEGPLKGIVFYNNDVSEEKRNEINDMVSKTYDRWNKTSKLTEEDLFNLKRAIEISTAKVSGNAIKFYDYEFDITNELDNKETEWIMRYTLKKNGKTIFEMNDFEGSLNYVYKGKRIIDLIIGCKKIELYTLFT